MNRYFSRKVLIILLAAIFIALATAVTITLNDTASGHIANFVNTITEPVKKGMAAGVDSLEQVYSYIYKYDTLEEENEELRRKIAELESQDREFELVNQENQQLRDLLDLRGRNDEYVFEAVSVLSWSASNYDSSFTISKGSDSGLELNDCVVTGSGYLVGQITELGKTTATVSTIIDPDMSIGAMVFDNDELAVAEGDYQLMKNGNLKLTYLSNDSQTVAGNTITTSGRSGMCPKGLVIGTVNSVAMDSLGLESYAVVEPSADLGRIDMVFVLTDFGLN